MVSKLREYWFGILISLMVFVCLIFSLIVVLSPHSDGKMRGFAPCTYELAISLSQQTGEGKLWGVASAVTDANLCYASVIGKGVELWIKGKQSTPWANYMYEPEPFYEDASVEPFSEDLLRANLLDDEDGEVVKIVDENVNIETVEGGQDEQK